MTAYQSGYAVGLRTRVSRTPTFPDTGDKARWRSGFYDAQQAKAARRANQNREAATFGTIPRGW